MAIQTVTLAVGRDMLDGRVAFEISRHPRRRGRYQMLRVSIQCYETGSFASVDEAKRWADTLNRRLTWTKPTEPA